MKWIKRLIILVVVLVLVAVGGLYFGLNAIVKSAVEKEGTEQLKVQTTLGGVSLDLFNGSVGMDSFALGSPSGFTAPQMFAVNKTSFDSGGISNLRGDPIHVASIAIEGPVLVIEQSGTTLNFKKLIDGLPSSPSTKSPTPSTPPPASETKETRFKIDSLKITNAEVKIQSDIPGLTKPLDLKIPDCSMDNIGNENGNGIALKDLIVTVITKMVAEASHNKDVPASVGILLTGNLTDVQGKLSGAAQNEIGKLKLPGNLGGTAGNAANGLINQGFNLLNGGDKKK
jgi:hypothetical protein